MLYPFRVIGEDRVSLSPLSAPPAACMLEIVRGLNELFDETPAILHLPDSSVLTLLYQNTVYQWQDLLDTIGPAAAALSQVLPLRFWGTTEARETAELSLRPGPQGLVACRRSVSGRPFSRLQGLGVQAEWETSEAAEDLAELVAAVPHRAPCGAVDGRHRALLQSCDLLVPSAGSQFAYFAWESAVPPLHRLLALTLEHKLTLWRTFLLDRAQPLEFDWLWDHYYTGEGLFLLEWELTLRMALDSLGFQVIRNSITFQVFDGDGRERRFDFARGGPAEKLFLKLLFPLDDK